MNRIQGLLAAAIVLISCAWHAPAQSADMTFQLINDTERQLSLKFFSRGESRQEWPSRTKSYVIHPDPAVQQMKLSCEAGEEICWGAWMTVQSQSGEMQGNTGQRTTHTGKVLYGTGDRGIRPCEYCCHVCKEGLLTRIVKMSGPATDAK
jgi:hypothetical protein